MSNRELFETGFNSNLGSSIKTEATLSQPLPFGTSSKLQETDNPLRLPTFHVKNVNDTVNNHPGSVYPFAEPTLNMLNTSDYNTSFDTFVQSIRIASTGEINWNLNDIDTSQFKCNFCLHFFLLEAN